MSSKRVSSFEGAVIPPYAQNPTPTGYNANPVRGMYLRIGRVVAAYSPEDTGSQSKKFMEYDVEVVDGTPTSTLANFKILRCRVADSFGGAADFSRWTPRVSQETDPVAAEPESLVLVQCISGKLFQGVIIGAMPNSLNKEEAPDGHSAVWQFNGVRAQVDKEGQFKLSFKGATDSNNNLVSGADASASGATFQITKDGSIKLFTKDDSQFIDFNHTSKTVALTSEKETTLTCKSGLIKTSSTGVHLGMATDDMVKGTTYRTQEAVLHSSMQAAFATLGTSLATAGAALGAAAAAATPAPPAPPPPISVIAPSLLAASSALVAAQAALTNLATAIATFEAQASAYLSTKNKLD